MYKEKQIIEKYPFTKVELVAVRKDKFQEGVDWIREPSLGHKSGAVQWTMKGLVALLASKGLVDDFMKDTPAVEVKPEVNPEEPKPIDKCHGIVTRIYPNKRVIDCSIRGVKHQVFVKNSQFLKLGTFIACETDGSKWTSNFKIDSRGKVHD